MRVFAGVTHHYNVICSVRRLANIWCQQHRGRVLLAHHRIVEQKVGCIQALCEREIRDSIKLRAVHLGPRGEIPSRSSVYLGGSNPFIRRCILISRVSVIQGIPKLCDSAAWDICQGVGPHDAAGKRFRGREELLEGAVCQRNVTARVLLEVNEDALHAHLSSTPWAAGQSIERDLWSMSSAEAEGRQYVGSGRHSGTQPKPNHEEMMAFLEGLDPKVEVTELVLRGANAEEGESVADIGDCATSSADVMMGTLIKEKAGGGGSGQGRNRVDLRSQVLGLLLAVIIGWLLATVTQLMQRWTSS